SEMNSWKEKHMMALQSFSSLMAVTRPKFQTSHGTRTNHGLYLVLLRTMLYRSSKWPKAFIAEMMTFEDHLCTLYELEIHNSTLLKLE
ncbi:hypothetical protein Tco_0225340, partial [Tanacetum coccineum]